MNSLGTGPPYEGTSSRTEYPAKISMHTPSTDPFVYIRQLEGYYEITNAAIPGDS
jgi:hypothetical protein